MRIEFQLQKELLYVCTLKKKITAFQGATSILLMILTSLWFLSAMVFIMNDNRAITLYVYSNQHPIFTPIR